MDKISAYIYGQKNDVCNIIILKMEVVYDYWSRK